jgi:hypothetical protein
MVRTNPPTGVVGVAGSTWAVEHFSELRRGPGGRIST